MIRAQISQLDRDRASRQSASRSLSALGAFAGEDGICAIYIFAGSSLLDLGKRWLGA